MSCENITQTVSIQVRMFETYLRKKYTNIIISSAYAGNLHEEKIYIQTASTQVHTFEMYLRKKLPTASSQVHVFETYMRQQVASQVIAKTSSQIHLLKYMC